MTDRCRHASFADVDRAQQAASSLGAPWRARHCAACGLWRIASDELAHFRLPPALGRAAVRGDKTTHRIPAGRARHCPYIVGHSYPLEYEQPLANELGDPVNDRNGIQRTTFTTDTIVVVTSIERQSLIDIDDDAAVAEGFKGFDDFLDYWNDAYNPHAASDDDDKRHLSDRRMNAAVWVVHFTVEHQDTVRLLVADETRAQAAYTATPASALRGEMEAIDPDIIADLPASIEAQQRWHRDRATTQASYAHLSTEELVALALRRMREARIADETENGFERVARKKATDILRRLDRAA